MMLVDTPFWIEPFRRPRSAASTFFPDPDEIVTCLQVIEEVLQGIHDERPLGTSRNSTLSSQRLK